MDEAAVAAELAREAGALLLEESGSVDRRAKGRFDLVTAADTRIEDFLASELERRFPGDRLLAEESSARKPASVDGRCWVIDPLDGTVNFASGVPVFSISLALLADGVPILGVVYDPVHDELFSARRGHGASLNGRPMEPPSGDGPPLSLGGSSGLLAWCVHRRPAVLGELLERFGKLRILGSQALHLCYVAAGRLAAALSIEARLWDDAAGALMVEEMDFTYSDFDGRKRFPVATGSPWLRGHAGRSLAAPAGLHVRLVALLGQREEEAEIL